MKTIDEKIMFLINNSEYDCCEDAYEYWSKNEWRDNLSDSENLERFENWCDTFNENEDEE